MLSLKFHELTQLTSLGNSGLCWTVFARNRDTAVPAEGNGDLQTLICVLVARPRRCLTLSNPVPWQNWMAAYLGYTLRMRTLFRGWPIMVNDTHTRRSSNRAAGIDTTASYPFDCLVYCMRNETIYLGLLQTMPFAVSVRHVRVLSKRVNLS